MIRGMVRNDRKDCVGQVIHININIIIYICTVFILNIGTDRLSIQCKPKSDAAECGI